jgi:hypothetical protein
MKNLTHGTAVDDAGTNELALDDQDTLAIVVNNDRVNLFVVGAVGNRQSRRLWALQKHASQVPRDEPLSIVSEVLRVKFVGGDFVLNLRKHRGRLV